MLYFRANDGATGVEPNQFLTVYFSRSIEPGSLEVNVYETVHGLTYVDGDAPGPEPDAGREAPVRGLGVGHSSPDARSSVGWRTSTTPR